MNLIILTIVFFPLHIRYKKLVDHFIYKTLGIVNFKLIVFGTNKICMQEVIFKLYIIIVSSLRYVNVCLTKKKKCQCVVYFFYF
jgi:hypothetical protein